MISRILPRWLAFGLIGMITLASISFAFKVAQATPQPASAQNAAQAAQPDIPTLLAHPSVMSDAEAADKPHLKQAHLNSYDYDMAAHGVSALPLDKPFNPGPPHDGNALGTSNAFMSVDPQVVSTTTSYGVASLSSGFTMSETVAFSVNGAAATNYTADSSGFLGVLINSSSTEGYVYVTAIGLTSGKESGGNFLIRNNARQTVGVAVAPHSVGPG